MIKNKKKRLYAGALLVSIIIVVLVVIEVIRRRERDLPPRAEQVLPSKVESTPSAEIETGGSIDQTERNAVTEATETKVGELADPLFNELVERDVRAAAHKMKQDLWLRKHIDGRKEFDRKINKKWDLPEDVLGETSTDKLFLHFIRSPMIATVMLYSDDEIGVQRLLNASSTLHEFYMRGDLAEGALRMYREYDLSPEAMSDESIRAVFSRDKRIFEYPETKRLLAPDGITNTKITSICMNIWFADRIMLTKQFFPKLKGHEREFLSVMLDRYSQISELSKKYPGGSVGTARSCVPHFCRSLAKNIDEDFYARLQTIEPYTEEGEKQFIEEIERYLRN